MPPKLPPGAPPAPRNDHRDAFERGTNLSSAADQLARTAALEDDLETLRIHYEQYFLGLTRKPPTQERAGMRAAVLQLKSSFVRNTAVKFRVQALHNRYLSYERMWDRTLREIEDGTYRRDLFKARLHRARAEATGAEARSAPAAALSERPGTADGAGAGDGDFDVDEGSPEAPGAAAGPPPATVPPRSVAAPRPAGPAASGGGRSPAGTPGGLDDARIRELHAAYVEARRRCHERTDGLTVEAVAAALRKQVPELLARHGARSIDFQVVVKDGKAILKAYPH